MANFPASRTAFSLGHPTHSRYSLPVERRGPVAQVLSIVARTVSTTRKQMNAPTSKVAAVLRTTSKLFVHTATQKQPANVVCWVGIRK